MNIVRLDRYPASIYLAAITCVIIVRIVKVPSSSVRTWSVTCQIIHRVLDC